jgi:hypothetical protein
MSTTIIGQRDWKAAIMRWAEKVGLCYYPMVTKSISLTCRISYIHVDFLYLLLFIMQIGVLGFWGFGVLMCLLMNS